jgi:hypothetical protein
MVELILRLFLVKDFAVLLSSLLEIMGERNLTVIDNMITLEAEITLCPCCLVFLWLKDPFIES